VRVRHATEADMGFIVENLEKYNFDMENLHYSQFVVAMENGNPIGFGRIKKTGEIFEIGCITVVEERRNQGIGSLIIKHLVDFTPVKMVYVITDLVDYFKRLGFVETKEGSKEIMGALDRVCGIEGRKNTVLMAYKKD
jgi:N-acetylglutamate synthase-like GNAT family acetyltransferase